MRKQKSREKSQTRAIDRAPNDAGAIGDRIADLMLHPLDGTANAGQRIRSSIPKHLRTKGQGEENARATERSRSRK
jgi:hypothetical protein